MISDKTAHADSVTAPSMIEQDKLHPYIFTEPKDYLNALRSDFNKIDPKGTGELNEKQLRDYAEHGTDEAGRAAAGIAADHFKDMLHLSDMPTRPNPFVHIEAKTGISRSDLDLDLKLATGNISWEIAKHELGSGAMTAAEAVATGLCGWGTAASIEIPPLAFGAGALTAATAVETGLLARETYSAPGKIRDLAARDQKMLASWGEINVHPE